MVPVPACSTSAVTELCAMWLQENVKARHPQLLYESKLYKILQGGGKFSHTIAGRQAGRPNAAIVPGTRDEAMCHNACSTHFLLC